jgi:hypothetical protein
MRTLFRLTLLVLALTAATSVFYAFQQQKSLRDARSAAEALEKERADLRKKLWDAERRRNELEAQLRAKSDGSPDANSAAPASAENAAMDAAIRMAGNDGPFGRFMAMMDNPEVQRLVAAQQRGALDARYAALFKSLNLTPQQLEQFKNLLVEKRTAVADVMAAARSQGLTGRENRDEVRALVQNAQNEVDNNIRSTLGEAAYSQYQNFEQTQPQRAVVSQLQQRLSYSGTPLTDAQSEQLVQVLASSTPTNGGGATGATPRPGGVATRLGFNGGAAITDQAVSQSSTVLAPAQVQALQQLQQEQQAQAQLTKIMRDQFQNRRNGGGGNTTTTTPTSAGSPPKG